MNKRHDATFLTTFLTTLLACFLALSVATVHAADPVHNGEPHAATHNGDAHADDDHAHDQPSLFTGDLGNIFWSWLTFILVIVVLGKFAWKPILGGLQNRESFIRDSLAQAKSDRQAAEARLREFEQKLQTARDEASAIVEEGKRDADVLRRKFEQDARNEADAMIERAKSEISLARDTAVKELYGLTAQLATEVAGKIVGKEFNPADHERLVTESIEELSKLSVN
jgi:F-type H+-transporting ATPase subunit b